jgi:Holliday junction DNA helicase RuvA
MVLELKDKAGAVRGGGSPVPAAAPGWRDTLVQALTGLGWTAGQADDAVAKLAQAHPGAGPDDVPALLREALATLGRAR